MKKLQNSSLQKNNKLFTVMWVVILSIVSVSLPFKAAESNCKNNLQNFEGEIQLYISPDGNDNAEGSEDSPLATLEGVKNAVRRYLSADKKELPDGITVNFKEGVYKQQQTFCLSEEDSGSAECPIIYRACEGAEVIIDGGVKLDTEKFSPASGDILSRFSEDAVSNIKAYNLVSDGVDYSEIIHRGTHSALLPDCRLYVNNERAWLGRYPNNQKYESGYKFFSEFNDKDYDGYTFIDDSGKVKTWSEESIDDARIYGNFQIDWMASSGKILNYEPETERITFSVDKYDANQNGRYFMYNVPEEIDSPFEYYIDDNGMLYIYLPSGYETADINFAQCTGNIIEADVNYYTFEGLTFENSVDGLFQMNGNNNTVSGCIFRCCGGNAVCLNGNDVIFDSNDIYSVGKTALYVDGGEITHLIPSDNEITNNRIHDYAELNRVYSAGIDIKSQSVGITVSHNEIYYAPHQGIGFCGNDIIMEYNYIHDVCYESGDAGAVYTYSSSWSSCGMIFRKNIVENIVSKSSEYYTPSGVYIYAASGCAQIYSNLIINTDGFGILSGGHDNIIRDNMLIDSNLQWHAAAYYKHMEAHTAWAADENGLVSAFPTGKLWTSILNYPPYATTSWYMRYPWVMLIKTTNVYDFNDRFVGYAYGDALLRNNVFRLLAGTNDISKDPARLVTIRDNKIYTNIDVIGFKDFENRDYTISEDSRIYHDIPGFKYCDVKNVGAIR